MFYKPEIREKMLRRRHQLDLVSMTQAAQAVAAQAVQVSEFLQSQHLAFYFQCDNELNTMPLMHCAENLKKKLYLPILSISAHNEGPHPLQFYQYQIGDTLIKNSFAINEPDASVHAKIPTEDLDVIFVPLVAFDFQGNRLGRGAGHYDVTFSSIRHKKPFLIGLGYEFQKVDHIVPDKWDIPMDMIITENKTYLRQS